MEQFPLTLQRYTPSTLLTYLLGLPAFHNKLIPSLQDKPPDPDKASHYLWSNIYELVIAKLKSVTQFLHDCEDHVNQLYHSPLLQVECGPECGPTNG